MPSTRDNSNANDLANNDLKINNSYYELNDSSIKDATSHLTRKDITSISENHNIKRVSFPGVLKYSPMKINQEGLRLDSLLWDSCVQLTTQRK